MKAKYLLVKPTNRKSADGYFETVIEIYQTQEQLEANTPVKVWISDSIIFKRDNFQCDFEFDGIRYWSCLGPLEISRGYTTIVQ